ncbi:response regulator transcription factor [Microbacterium sp. ASV49]|uniref:Response regulator transcription factor n=1 Tax=Microbacterium candidum TaxID=3041922 RepID=A0ABT7MVT6_9MICO|nr:response regulator transcription factor [Microbacterium sp. ASV49]MDL9978566.1 response regulator transcription factor [Microbacterium sp. ASV49]
MRIHTLRQWTRWWNVTVDARNGLVMLVEDEPAIADVQRRYFVDAGYGVHVERDGAAALRRIRDLRPVAIVLDIGIPTMDGLAVCRALRAEGDWTPIVFVTARDDEVDRILGIELGGDDYLTKPFSPRELVARVGGVLRRTARPAEEPLRSGDIVLDEQRHSVSVAGEPVDLTATEFALLAQLMREPHRVFSREHLLSAVWGMASYAGTRTVDVHVAQVRAKLGRTDAIRTVRGVGYGMGEPSGSSSIGGAG